MAIEEKAVTEEAKQEHNHTIEQAQNKLIGDLLSTMDLPADENEEKEEKKAEEVKRKSEEPAEEEKEESAEENAEDGKENSGEEEVIPKSKYDKTVKEMEKRIKDLSARVKQTEAKAESHTSQDADLAKLEKMSESELKNLKRQVRIAQIKETDEVKQAQFLELEDKIDDVIHSAPNRFQEKQVQLYNAKAEEVMNDSEIEDVGKAAPKILEIAKQIYQQYPKLQKLEDGQAMALELAANHYKELNKLSAGKSKIAELKRENNTLKRKTSLDSTNSKGNSARVSQSKSEAKAYGSHSTYDKEEFVKNDPRFNVDALIPDSFKEK